MSEPKLLLIDANNMSHRVHWAHKELSWKGTHVGVIFGFFKQLIHLNKEYPEHYRVIVWDAGHARRTEESERAVQAGIVPSSYKATRDHDNEEREIIFEQMDELKEGLRKVKCLQVWKKGFEADDIINTYAKYAQRCGGEAVVVSSDKDFYQVLDDNVKIYDAMKKEVWSRERFEMEFGFHPELWVDAGAIMGEVGKSKDNIFGVEGWGPTYACKYVKDFGSVEEIRAHIKSKEGKKLGKREQKFIDSDDVLDLALSLKRMDVVRALPKPDLEESKSEDDLKKYFLEWGFASLLKEARRLV